MSLMPEQLQDAASEAVACWQQSRELTPFSDRLPGFDLQDGYAVMQALHAHRLRLGWRPVGRKIGFTNTTIWERYGVHHPIWGWVYDRTLLSPMQSPATGLVCSLGGLVQPRIEPEIVIGLREAPPADGDLQAVLDCVDWIAHGFEIVQSHYPGWRFAAADSVAFGSLHGRLMVGPRMKPQALGRNPQAVVQALASFELTLRQMGPARADGGRGDGMEIDRGRGAHVLGNPLAALAHLQGVLMRQSPEHRLRAGEVVTTGTVTDAHAVAPGQVWASGLQGIALPGLEVRFTA